MSKLPKRSDGTTWPASIRRNWGYHDALLHAETSFVPQWRRGPRDTHFDKAYAEGYYAGMDTAKGNK